MSWLATRRLGPWDVLIAGLLFLCGPTLVVTWALAHPQACLLGEDVGLWGAAVEGMLHGQPGLASMLNRQPVYPALVALASLGPWELDHAFLGVSATLLGVVLAELYLVSTRLFGRGAGLVAVMAMGGHELVLARGATCTAELALVALAIPLLGLLARAWRQPTVALCALAGTLLALAQLSKPQAVLLLPLLLVVALRAGPRRWACLGAALGPMALILGGWAALAQLHGGLPRGPLVMAVTDQLHSTPDYAMDSLRAVFTREGWPAPPADASPSLRLAWTFGVNILRQGGLLLSLVHVLVWLPLVLALSRGRAERSHVIGLLLAGSAMVLALPVLWNARHLLPFLAALAMASGAVVPLAATRFQGRARTLGVVLPLVIAALNLPLHLASATSAWTEAAPTHRCDAGVREAGAWLRAHVEGTDPSQILAMRHDGVQVLGGMVRAGDPWAARAMFEEGVRGPEDPATLWLVTGLHRPWPGERLPSRERLLPEAELAWQSGQVRIWRLQWPRDPSPER